MAITNLNFRVLVNKHDKDSDKLVDELNVNENKIAYLREAISEDDQSIEITSNGNPLVENEDFTVNYSAAVVTFTEIPVPPVVARYYGVGSIIWAQDVTEVQNAVRTINTGAVNKSGDILEGDFNFNDHNITNVNTINGVNITNHNHVAGNGAQIPTNGIQDNAITTDKIQNLSITHDKLSTKEFDGEAAIGKYNIQDGAVTDVELANNSVSTSKIQNGAVTNDKIQNGTINFNKLNAYDLINTLYPVGSIYIGLQDTCPLASFGTTWQKISDGYYLQQKLPNKSLGNLVSAGLPNIYGEYYNVRQSVYDAAHMYAPTGQLTYTNKTNYPNVNERHSYQGYEGIVIDASRGSNIYGKSDTVQTNAIQVNIWKRTA